MLPGAARSTPRARREAPNRCAVPTPSMAGVRVVLARPGFLWLRNRARRHRAEGGVSDGQCTCRRGGQGRILDLRGRSRWPVAGQLEAAERIAQQVRLALEAADLSAFSDLLDPDVHWGPPGCPSPPCQDRDQVLPWYRRGRQAGVRARVSEAVVLGDRILVGLRAAGNQAAERGGETERWQVLTVRGGREVDSSGSISEARPLPALGWPPLPAIGPRSRDGRSHGVACPMTGSDSGCLSCGTPRCCTPTRPATAVSTGLGAGRRRCQPGQLRGADR
jgi:hypothetical protein